MKFVKRCLFILAGLIVLTGCNGGESDREAERETVFDPLTGTLDRAEATQELERERKRRIDEELEK